MKRQTKFTLIFVLLLTAICILNITAHASVSFTYNSRESKTIIIPNINSDVTHYRFVIMGTKTRYDSSTSWISFDDVHNHISMLDADNYIVTIIGRNTTSGLTSKFTNTVVVTVTEEYVEPEEEVILEDIGSKIINAMPEPFKSWFKARSGFELFILVLSSLVILFIVTRRKKKETHVILERFYEQR